ncbi:MAG: TIGR00180 family glycosyltransferase [Methanocorpusculum sp.]|uniref:TIGR00180 family glycosyltransferase n=1 Tax=Methanocorpusculum sp. TaxID=2058474 RepID=UPI002B1F2972|nr:TIGR00180 family glycosyltransferase [Methanocorpusculum sp.]MEA5086493.1 TIGR00180 family glycosyltransferase [Methanocorpusculum sp.]
MMREPDFVDECYADKDLSLLKKLTLVIPTYNRNYYLSRCLWYHAHFPFGEIIVADSSPEEKKVVNRETVAKVREMFGANVRYLEYEPETEKYGGDIYRKWGDAVQHVETEYSQICTDKEFLILTTICDCISFCDENNEYIAAFGIWYNVSIDHITDTTTHYVLSPNDIGKSHKLDVEDKLERFLDAFVHPQTCAKSLLLATSKTEILKQVYEDYAKSSINDIRYAELYLAYTGYLFGKVHCFNLKMHKIRDEIVIQIHRSNSNRVCFNSFESSTTRYPSTLDYKKFNDAKNFVTNYQKSITLEIIKITGCDLAYAQSFVANLMCTPLFGDSNTKINLKQIAMNIYMNRPVILKIWTNIPVSIQEAINMITSTCFNVPLPISTLTPISITSFPEATIINKILEETVKYHNNDSPIIISERLS